jgi:hypothetical protein
MLDRPAGARLVADIDRQNALFRRHLVAASGGAERLILCDTGLYGSTQRLLAGRFSGDELRNRPSSPAATTRVFSEDHFPRVVGLAVERNRYSPISVRSTVLRYWQLIRTPVRTGDPVGAHFFRR